MLKYILFALVMCIATPSFCSIHQLNHSVFTTNSSNNKFAKKQHKFIKKKILSIKKRFPVFAVASFIATLLGVLSSLIKSKRDDSNRGGSIGMLVGALLLLLAIFLGIAGLVAGEFWVYPVLGILLPIIIVVLFAVAVSKE